MLIAAAAPIEARVGQRCYSTLNDSCVYTIFVSSSRTTRTTTDSPGVLDERATSEGLLLAILGQHAMRRLRVAHTAHDLSPRQFHLLGLLHDRGAITQSELGALIDVAPSILVTLLNPLEADGYLSRVRDPADRRRHVITLTPAGQRQLDACTQAQRQAEDELLASLTSDQREQLRHLLLTLRDHLTIVQDPACPTSSPAELP